MQNKNERVERRNARNAHTQRVMYIDRRRERGKEPALVNEYLQAGAGRWRSFLIRSAPVLHPYVHPLALGSPPPPSPPSLPSSIHPQYLPYVLPSTSSSIHQHSVAYLTPSHFFIHASIDHHKVPNLLPCTSSSIRPSIIIMYPTSSVPLFHPSIYPSIIIMYPTSSHPLIHPSIIIIRYLTSSLPLLHPSIIITLPRSLPHSSSSINHHHDLPLPLTSSSIDHHSPSLRMGLYFVTWTTYKIRDVQIPSGTCYSRVYYTWGSGKRWGLTWQNQPPIIIHIL